MNPMRFFESICISHFMPVRRDLFACGCFQISKYAVQSIFPLISAIYYHECNFAGQPPELLPPVTDEDSVSKL
jgi:hypothetical protein